MDQKKSIGDIVVRYEKMTDEQSLLVLYSRNNEQVRRWMHNSSIIKSEEHQEFIHKLKNEVCQRYWAIFDERRCHVGSFSLTNIDHIAGTSYLGMFKNPECTRKKIGDILIAMIIDEAKKIGIKKLLLEVFENNEAAIRVYKKNGFLPVKVDVAARTVNDQSVNLVTMCLDIRG